MDEIYNTDLHRDNRIGMKPVGMPKKFRTVQYPACPGPIRVSLVPLIKLRSFSYREVSILK